MYRIEGTIDLKISRKELELLLNSLKASMSIIKNESDNLDEYKKLLTGLAYVEKQWKEKEEAYYESEGIEQK